MGKYSNVNPVTLLSTTNQALNEISKYRLKDVSNNLLANNVLDSNVGKQVTNSLAKVESSYSLNGNINNLEKKLQNLKEAAGYIRNYKIIENEIRSLQNEMHRSENIRSIQSRINSKKNDLIKLEAKIDRLLS